MDLQYLNGFDDYSMGQLGKVKKGAAKKSLPIAKKKTSILAKVKAKKAAKPKPQPGAAKPKKKGFFKKVLNTVNRVNPATVLLRNGVLAAMKLNVKNVAGRLRWSYLTPEQAAGKGIDPQKFQRLVATREKLEKIFYGAGGNPKNLKKAMLGGKGNKDKAVAGLDGFSLSGIEYMSTYTPLPQLLGPEIYHSENVEGFEGLGQLGEPLTLASVGAAMGVLAGIVAALKQIGEIFPKGSKESKDFDEATNEAAENNLPVPGTTPVPLPEAGSASSPLQIDKPSIEESFKKDSIETGGSGSNNALVRSSGSDDYSTATNSIVATNENDTVVPLEKDESLLPATTATTTNTVANTNTTDAPPKETFWEKNKSWLKPVAIGVGGVSLIAIGFAVMKPKHTVNKSPSRSSSLSGLPRSKKRKGHHHRKTKSAKSKPRKKTAVALL
ncbi:MAG: hypothetical protein EON98_00665 [Chitinophagaceae bacterium]|nr:MAG: hypothetical protein EON98_00665 [Chitinophagaceae bacterium]